MLTLIVCLAATAVCVAWRIDWREWWSGNVGPRVVQPVGWGTQGPVALLELDQSSDWRNREESQRFPLIVDDRWDALGEAYPEYAAIQRDLREVRDHRYLRADGEWGGYREWLKERSPVLLAADSSDVEAIRALTLSPDWKVMGIDGQFTIFGRNDHPGNRPQMQRALECLLTLEWPARLSGFSLENTIVAANDVDDRTVAGAMCAMRFPYAGLRFLRDDASFSAQTVRAGCLIELAHRVAQHSSTESLLDQFRAVVLVREMLADPRLGSEERDRLMRGLESLGVAIESRISEGTEATSSEERLRAALVQGDVGTALSALEHLDASSRQFYRMLIEAPDQTAEAIAAGLHSSIAAMGDGVSAERKGEALFYLGCAALESGDALTALTAFQDSLSLAPQSPFREIRGVYMRQMLR